MWLEEQIAFFSRETGLRPENPRAWKMLGLAYLLKGYFDTKCYRPAAESYAECIRGINQYSEGVIVGLVMAGIGPLTPNHPRFELGLALAGAREIESAVYHLRFCEEGQAVLNNANYVGIEAALRVALEEYQLERLGECCANRLFPSPQDRGRMAEVMVMFMACMVCGENLAFEQIYPSTWQCPICGNLTTFEGPDQITVWHPIASGLSRPTIPIYEPIRTPENFSPLMPGMPAEQMPVSLASALIVQAEELLSKGNVDEAINVLGKAVKLRPDHGGAFFLLGNAYIAKGLISQALDAFQKAVNAVPDFYPARYNIGLIQLQTGQLAAAASEFQKVIDLRPELADAHYHLGLVRLYQQDIPQAIRRFEESARLNPSDVATALNLANCYQAQQRIQDAIQEIHRIITLHPDCGEAYHNLGSLYAQLGWFNDALREFLQAVRLLPNDSETHANLGMVYEALGRIQEARKHFELALRFDPNNWAAQQGLARLHGPW
jgi:tetratricopeptide (TPR) repeat protein